MRISLYKKYPGKVPRENIFVYILLILYSIHFFNSFQNFFLIYQYMVYQSDILSLMNNQKMDKQKTFEGKARSEGTRPVLSRIYFIDRQIAAGKYPSTKQLAEEYEVGTATISRDIEFLRDMLDAPIEYDAQHRGYYYSDKRFRLPSAFSRAEDMLALGMAKSLLSLYRNTPLFNAARNLLDSITAPLDKVPFAGQKKWYQTRIVVPQSDLAPVADKIWNILTAGLRENRVVVEYTETWDKEPQPRRVQPYQLLFDNGVWYLYGFSEERQAVRMFSLA
jgi:predicted DNA-binding transcriptional regulator YafY